jgi:UDPglucose--hexose-1-phosphate uridylyltransferase
VQLTDPTTGRPVLMAPSRQQRPFLTGRPTAASPCPFCPGNERATPPEVDAFRAAGTAADAPGWSVRVFPNKYPASDCHEVVAECEQHVEQPGDLDVGAWRRVLAMWQRRIRAIEARPGVRCAFLFKNVGAPAGASIAHSHSQLLGLDAVPPRLLLERQRAAALDRCPWCATLATAGPEGRVVVDAPGHVVLAPDPPKLPHETWLLPRRCDDDFLQTDLDSLAAALAALFVAVRDALGGPPFNLWLHRIPRERFHWHFELQPRTGQLAGLELGGDMYINSLPAADAAARLRRAR